MSSGGGLCEADTSTWTGNSGNLPGTGNNNWSNFFNWQGGVPDNDGTADVVMPDTPRDNPNVDEPWSISSLTFQGPGNYSVNGDSLTLNEIAHDGTGTATFNNSVGVSGLQATWHAASGPMVFHGAITGSNPLALLAPQPITFDGSAANTLTGGVSVAEGTLILSKSTANGAIAGNLVIDSPSGGTATVRWDGPNQVAEQVSVRRGALGDLNGHDETVSQLSLVNDGRVHSTGGKLTVMGVIMQGDGEIDLGSGELALRGTVTRAGAATTTSRIKADLISLGLAQNFFDVHDSPADVELELDGEISGGSGSLLQKTTSGALRLTGANTYQGGTTISGGTLIVDNATGSATGTNAVTVQTGARLAGDGAISGQVSMQNGATIAPSGSTGFPIGSLTIGSLNMNTTSVLEVQFNQQLPVALRRDVLTVTGNASIIGNLVLENLNSTVPPPASATFTILAAASLTGSFANVPNGMRLDTIDSTGSFIVNYGPGSPFDPTDVVLSDFAVEGLTGDFDNDGDVDGRDFLVWQRGGSPSPLSAGDLAAWGDDFGQAVSVHTVPEPCAGTLALVVLGAAASRARAWRRLTR
jgi:autotransporter-associated beta strand protein